MRSNPDLSACGLTLILLFKIIIPMRIKRRAGCPVVFYKFLGDEKDNMEKSKKY